MASAADEAPAGAGVLRREDDTVTAPAAQAATVSDMESMSSARKMLVALCVAAKDGKVKEMRRAVHKLVKASGGSPEEVLKNTVDGKRRSAMHFAANFGKLETVQLAYAINKEAITWEDSEGATALTLAALGGRDSVVQWLLEKGADVTQRRANGDQPLHIASQYGHKRVVELLLAAKAPVDEVGGEGTPVWYAAGDNKGEVLDLLLAAGAKPNIANARGITPLIVAAAMGHMEAVAKLVKAGANVTSVGEGGITALHMAAENERQDVVAALLEADSGKVTPKATDMHGMKPVHLAAGRRCKALVSLLLPHSDEPAEATAESLIEQHAKLRADEEAQHYEAQLKATGDAEPPMPPPAASDADVAKASEVRKEANRKFVAGDHAAALELYTRGIELDGRSHVLWANRAACHMAMEEYTKALFDARTSCVVKPDFAKGHYRIGKALIALNRLEDATAAFWEGCKLDPQSKGLRDAMRATLEAARAQHKAKAVAAAQAAASASAGTGAGAGAGAGAGDDAGADVGAAADAGASASASASASTATGDVAAAAGGDDNNTSARGDGATTSTATPTDAPPAPSPSTTTATAEADAS